MLAQRCAARTYALVVDQHHFAKEIFSEQFCFAKFCGRPPFYALLIAAVVGGRPWAPRPAVVRAEAPRPRPIVPLPTHQLRASHKRPPAVNWPRRSHRARRAPRPRPWRTPSRTQGREAARLRTPPDAARGVPAASRPAHGGGSNARKRASAAPNGGVRLRPRRRHSRRGPLSLAPCGRPSRPYQVLARLWACGICRPLRLHAIAPAGRYLSAARLARSGRHLLPQYSARARLSRASPRLGRGRRRRRRPLTACARPLPTVAGGVSHAIQAHLSPPCPLSAA